MRVFKAFTLVELLVVVSIITVLISMLVPATEKAIGHAQAAVCASNQHQVGIAIFHYMTDHNRIFPYGFRVQPGAVKHPSVDSSAAAGWPAKPPQQLLLMYSGESKAVWVCPTDASPMNYNWWEFRDAPDWIDPDSTKAGEVRTPNSGQGLPIDNTGTGVDDPSGGWLAPNERVYGRNLYGSSFMFSEQCILGTAQNYQTVFKFADIEGSLGNLGIMSDGAVCPNGWTWKNIDVLDPTLPPDWRRIDWSHMKKLNFLFADMSVERESQWNPSDGGFRDHIRTDPFDQTLPQWNW